ncbi:hypothetical protein GGS20DRAFT_597172 [Poronia punctata]|nr:hypothetical protein GGS20DRAFT_597172 [Poronia punctata]
MSSPTSLHSSDKEDNYPLLHSPEELEKEDTTRTQNLSGSSSTNYWRFVYPPSLYTLAHCTVFVLYAIIFGLTFGQVNERRESSCNPIVYSPANEAIEYASGTVDGLFAGSAFVGRPNASIEAAWAALLRGSNLIIYPEEVEMLGIKSLALKDGSGYVGSLGVYHELHCIKRLRQWLYRDYFYPNQTRAEHDETIGHLAHCLETLRQAAMCHGDTTVRPFEWLRDVDGQVIGPTVKPGTLHQCVDWDKLSTWARSRRIDLADRSLLVPASSDG